MLREPRDPVLALHRNGLYQNFIQHNVLFSHSTLIQHTVLFFHSRLSRTRVWEACEAICKSGIVQKYIDQNIVDV
jgi:hypothetical protein